MPFRLFFFPSVFGRPTSGSPASQRTMLLLLLQVCALISVAFTDVVTPEITKFRHQTRRKPPPPSQSQVDAENTPSEHLLPLPRSNPQTIDDGVDYRLTRLEVKVGEKAEAISSELRETNRRLQALEWQSSDCQSATLESCRADLQRLSQQMASSLTQVPTQESTAKMEERLDHLAKGIMLVVVNWRILTADIAAIKTNISTLRNHTNAMLEANKHLLTKQSFNNGILDLQHRTPSYETCPQRPKATRELPKDCKDVRRRVGKQSGIYRIQPAHSPKSFMVSCDMETRDGGWIVIQSRYEGAQDFYQDWRDYKHGFGNLGGEFWLGLDNIHQLTGYEVGELLVELEDFASQKTYAHYSAFSVGPEVEGFPLKVLGGFSGDAGDSLIYHAGSRFSTKDLDQDGWPEGSCAQAHGGGWWYRGCDTSNLNGRYLNGELSEQYIYQGMYWGEFRGAQYSLYKVRMLVRPRDAASTPEILPLPRNDSDAS